MCGWSDRHPGTVIAVSKSGRRVTIREDSATRTDKNGFSESQTYDITPNPEGRTDTYSLRKKGRWVPVGLKSGGQVTFGHRAAYLDPSF
jgi:hypothetical protein